MRALLIFAAGCWTGAVESGPTTTSPPPIGVAPPNGVLGHQSAEALITQDQLRKATGFSEPLEARHGEATTPTYDDIHFQAVGKTERFDFMLRVWTLDAAGANHKLDEMAKELPGVKPLGGLADRAITAIEGEIYGVAFVDKRGACVLLTCGMGQCSSIDQVIGIARGVATRLR